MSAPHNNKQRLSARQGVALGLALLLAVLSATRLLTASMSPKPKGPQHEDNLLLQLLQASECKAAGADAQIHHAQELEQRAAAKMRRSVFVPSDGMQATKLLSEASLCFKTAGDLVQSQRLLSQWKRWHADLTNSFQNHRLRLELALAAKQKAQALSEVHILQALLKGALLPSQSLEKFTHWLDAQERQLNAKPAKVQ